MVIVIDENKDETGIVRVVEISEDIPQAIETDMILQPTESGLSFRCMVRTGNIFFTDKKNLKTFAGRLSPSLTTTVVRFCKTQYHFNDKVPLSEYVFIRDQEGNELMSRRGVTSGMLVTKDDDSRLNFLEQSKQRCSYLHYDQEMSGFAVAPEEEAARSGAQLFDLGKARRAKELKDAVVKRAGEIFGSSLVKKLWPIAAMILVAIVTAKTTQVILEGENLDLKKRNTELLAVQDGISERLAQAEKRREGPVIAMSVGRLEFDSVKGKAVLEAVHSGDMDALEELLQEKKYVGYRDDETGITPLYMAASEGQTAVANFLIEKGANVNAVDREGQTPLMKAAMKGDRGMVELLLKNGADVRMSDMGGRTALYWALADKHDDIVKLLRGF